ncbi:hypothetical protein PLESTB_001805300 [Pleodorina starrii]|uniref:S-acyltransferase n=1 Tax=Pleodorina starrii TaxID=330485 RepID=A0A9W6C0T9_9CHLO|nr:hypothetical protein PLESTB_001805300 [Pleodorina starrii]
MQPAVVDTLCKACAYGDFDKLRQFVEADPSSINKPDENGYYPLQWAALNNRVPESTYLLQRGTHVNATDHTGQTALHWAAVRGSLPVIEALLRHNADWELRDNRGYTVAHVAAQYGQTAVLYHLALRWNADVDAPDNDGRTPLHWAAYKGFHDTIRLLLVLDSRFTLADKEGCTPLHWAAIKGNGEACTVLLQGGSACVLTYTDVTGSTPAQLAIDKGHRYLGLYLAEYKSKHEPGAGAGATGGWFGKHGRMSWLTATQLCPFIWGLIIGLVSLFMYKVMDPSMGPALRFWGWSVAVSASLALVLLYRVTTSDPGYIPTGWETYSKRDNGGSSSGGGAGGNLDEEVQAPLVGGAAASSGAAVQRSVAASAAAAGGNGGGGGVSGGRDAKYGHAKALDSPALWAGNWQQLCVTCRIVRPLRAKHCSVTNRCIEVFDHFCPWVGNAIGKGNRHLFLAFLWVALYAMVASAVVGVIQINRHVNSQLWRPDSLVWMVVFEVVDVFVGLSQAAAAGCGKGGCRSCHA